VSKRQDRILVARLQGVALRFAGGFDQRDPGPLRAELDAGVGGPLTDEAVAALLEVTARPDLITESAAMFVDNPRPSAPWATRLLDLAGADLDAARAWKVAHPPNGFFPPQAEPRRDR
jgi:hypothetical protein